MSLAQNVLESAVSMSRSGKLEPSSKKRRDMYRLEARSHRKACGSTLTILVLAAGAACPRASWAAGTDNDRCGAIDRSSMPFTMQFVTSAGDLTLMTRRDGGTISIEGRRASGTRYTISRRNGYDLAYGNDKANSAIAYSGVSTDVSIAVTKPATYETTVSSFQGAAKARPVRYATTLSYPGEETIDVGGCSFKAIHIVEETRSLDGSPQITLRERWYAPALNISLRVIQGRREQNGAEKRSFEAHAVSVAPTADK